MKYLKILEKFHVYMSSHFASIKSTARSKTSFFPSPFFISASRFLILAEAFRNDHVASCSTAFCSATDKNEIAGYVFVLCTSKTTQRNSTVDWLKL